ncbi:MAG TPA: hypothetical protein VHG08_03150 [Longimicrobium sp.]|nr:hypothetical protein [Longimicrobium sp.]
MRLSPESLKVESFATSDVLEKVGAASSNTHSDCSCVCLAPTCAYEVCG